MASVGSSAFSPDGQYWAHCGHDGKLKIWETQTNRLKQDFVPNSHLLSPCSVLEWITVGQQSTSVTPSPWKKRKRKSITDSMDQKQMIAMGSVDGKIILYDISTSSVSRILEYGNSVTITALTWSATTGLFTAAEDHQIVEWNIHENGIKCKWKSGKSKVTALALPSDGKTIVSADKLIKWWSLETKQVIGTFTGHANNIVFLKSIKVDDNTSYLFSGTNGDAYLNVWSLNEIKNDKSAIATLMMQDDPVSISIQVTEISQIAVLAVNRSGQAHLFSYQPSGKSTKPLKPALTVVVASEAGQKESIQQIPIQAAYLTDDNKMLLTYGSIASLIFEKVSPDFTDKIQALIRSDGKRLKERKDESISKVKIVETDGNVEYLTPGAGNTVTKRNKNSTGSRMPLKERLENLSLNSDANTIGHTPSKGKKMAKLLSQGLASSDRNILTSVLFIKDETTIKNTIAGLSVEAVPLLLKELTSLLQGKTYISKIALTWLKILVINRAGLLQSLPDVGDTLNPILGFIDAKLMILTELSRLRGRVALVTGQISHLNKKDDDFTEECLVTYQDPDSSDEASEAGDVEAESGSDETWDEISDPEEPQEDEMENGKSDDDASICS